MARNIHAYLFACFLAVLLPGCGGGGASTGNPPPAPFFTIVAAPSPTAIPVGGTGAVQVSITGGNGFSGTVSVSITGLPSGVTATPSQFTVATNAVTVTFSAASSAATGNYPVAIQGISGSLSNSITDTLEVGPLASFSIIQPSNPDVVLRLGSSAQVQLQTLTCCAPAVAGYSLSFTATGLPAGVTASFSGNPIAAGSTTTLTLGAAGTAAVAQNLPFNITATPSASTPSQKVSLALSVAPAVGTMPNNRTDFVRTDGTPSSLVYDSVHQLIFASNLEWNRVDVVSPLTKQIVRVIPVPAPQGLALTSDGSQVLVGTETQQMVAIDTGGLRVVHHWYLPPVSTGLCAGQGYNILQIAPMASGKALLVCNVLYTTATGLLEWNPSTNTVTVAPLPPTFAVGGISGSANGTKTIIYSDVEPGAVALFDSTTDSISALKDYPGFVFGVQANPAGTNFIVLDDSGGLQLYDANLSVLGSIPPGAFDTGVVFSLDGSTIYVVADNFGIPAIFTVDAKTLTFVGMAPAYATIPPCCELSPPYVIETPFAVDSTGLIFGAADQGIALDDSNYFEALFPPANLPIFDKVLTPDVGPVNASTVVQVETSPFDAIPDAWFGSQRATNESLLNGGALQLAAPISSQPGPVNVKLIQPNGIQIFDPLAYSYGPAPLFLSGDSGSPSGSGSADIIALGVPADPSAIQVSIGGASASIISAKSFSNSAINNALTAFPEVDIKVNLPAGSPGLTDVTVSTANGTATLPKAFHFLQGVTDYPSADTFEAILYDRFRKQIYLSAGDHVDVFSVSSGKFLVPFQLPSVNGFKQFAGMALTPDGSQLVVANLRDGSVAIVNPDSPAGAKAAAVAPSFPGTDGPPCYIGPAYVATTSNGKAFVVFGGFSAINCGPGGPVYELDLSTLAVSSPPYGCGNGSFVSSTRDGSILAFGGSISAGGVWALYNAATNSCVSGSFYQPYGAAASGDGNLFAAGFRITDVQANVLNLMALPDPYYPGQFVGAPLGNSVLPQMEEKMNDSGSLLYVPFANSVDILDMQHATLRRRVSLQEQIPQVADALAIDPAGKSIFLITNKGLTLVDLDATPLSIGSVLPANTSVGNSITIRGSGFLQTTTAKLNGVSVSLTFIDENTLQLTAPSLSSGSVQIQLTNPDGSSYTLDDAFTIS